MSTSPPEKPQSTPVRTPDANQRPVADWIGPRGKVPVYRTEDGRLVEEGDRVFNYYDEVWGVIGKAYAEEGWFEHIGEDGQTRIVNGSRVSTYKPAWAK